MSALELATLTDEELVVLRADHPVVVLPHYEALAPTAQQVARHTAHRSLRARGMQWQPRTETALLPEPVSHLLEVREHAPSVLVGRLTVQEDPTLDDPSAGRTTSTDLYAHVVDDLALVESVDGDGLHTFVAMDRAELADYLQLRLPRDDDRLVRGATDAAGPLTVDLDALVRGEAPEVADLLGQVRAHLDVTCWHRGPVADRTLLGVVLTERHGWVAELEYGSPEPVELTPLELSQVGRRVTELLPSAQGVAVAAGDTMGA